MQRAPERKSWSQIGTSRAHSLCALDLTRRANRISQYRLRHSILALIARYLHTHESIVCFSSLLARLSVPSTSASPGPRPLTVSSRNDRACMQHLDTAILHSVQLAGLGL